jgi:oligopeptide/dipeptide ABC transporter ATP-binding protein
VALLEVKNLSISFQGKKVVDSVSFSVDRGEVLGIVGESGSGKTLTALSILHLTPPGANVEGEIIFDGRDILKLSEREMNKIRGKDISLILQNPHSAFNPVFKVGYQVIEPLLVHLGLERKKAFELAKDVFRQVGISEPDLRLKAYPHELSGGMKQRAVISVSILMRAKLIIADEPTTALDPTVESQILKLLRRIIDEQRSSMIFISHDISQVGWIADKIAVMYGGWIVEIGKKQDILKNPSHPYTKALLEAMPYKDRPKPIPGSPLDINYQGCRFSRRCPIAQKICFEQIPDFKELENGTKSKCFF